MSRKNTHEISFLLPGIGNADTGIGQGWQDVLLRIERQKRQVENDRQPVAVDNEEEGQESVNGGLWDDVGVQTVAKVDRVDVVTAQEKERSELAMALHSTARKLGARACRMQDNRAYHSRSLYMMVKKTWRNRLTALINTANR